MASAIDAPTETLRASESRYRRLFETAQDGILLLNSDTGQIEGVNPYLIELLGYSHAEFLGKKLWELGPFADSAHSKEMFAKLQVKGYVRYEDLPLKTNNGSRVQVEFVSNSYDCEGITVIQCNIRNITERKRAETALRNNQLSQAGNEAMEAERRRTARELHDELGQSLTVLKMDLESLQSVLPPNEPDLCKRAQAMHAILDATIAATRRIAANLRPMVLDDLGLAAALDWLTHNFSKHTGVATDLVIDDTVAQVPEPISSALYRITQESLTNVAKYAQATEVEIRLEQDGDSVRLLIRDNGRGIEEADQQKRGSFGLLGIRERVMLLSGEVSISGEHGHGSEVRVRIPLTAADAQERGA